MSEQNPSLIDYCLFGYGYYLFDLGSTSSMLNSQLRKMFLDGYASKTSFSFDETNLKVREGTLYIR